MHWVAPQILKFVGLPKQKTIDIWRIKYFSSNKKIIFYCAKGYNMANCTFLAEKILNENREDSVYSCWRKELRSSLLPLI